MALFTALKEQRNVRWEAALHRDQRAAPRALAPRRLWPFSAALDLFVYMIATLLYERLTLQRLFKRPSTAATLLAVLHDDVPPVTPMWDSFLRRALAKVPSRRF